MLVEGKLELTGKAPGNRWHFSVEFLTIGDIALIGAILLVRHYFIR